MSVYPPPTQITPIFNPNDYETVNNTSLTIDYANDHYLSYPVAQGTETLLDVIIDGSLTSDAPAIFNGGVTINSALGLNELDFNDGFTKIYPQGKYLRFNNTNTAPCGFSFYLPGAGGNPLPFSIANNGVQSNVPIQVNGWPISLDSNNNVGIQLDSSYTRLNLVNANSLFNFVTTLGGTPLLSITPSLTSISTPTQINTLSSTTQANNDNSTKVATTQYVYNMINTIPSQTPQLPYLWCYGQKTTGANFGNLSLNFNGASWTPNSFFTIRFVFQAEWSTPSVALDQYYYIYSGIMNIYPNRVPTQSGANLCLLNGSIAGNANYSMTDPTYAPNGRWYWVENYSNSQVINNSFFVTNPITITSVSQSALQFLVTAPFPTTGQYIQTCNIQILQQGPSGLTVTSSGVTNYSSYYNTF